MPAAGREVIRWQLPAELGRTLRGTLLEIAAMQCYVGKTDANYFMVTLKIIYLIS